MVAAMLLFGTGVLACLAWQSGLYASAAVAVLAGLWIAGAMLWRRAPMRPLPEPAPPAAAIERCAAEANRRQLLGMLDQTPAPLLTLADDGVLRAGNRAARALFQTDDRITQAPAMLREAIGRTRPGERAVLRLPARGPEPDRPYALSVANSTGPAGALRLAVLTDIQAELHAAEAAALRDLLQVLSHEIMNSLTPVTSLAESAHALLVAGLTEGAVADVPRAAEALEIILRRARGLDRFVQGYRTWAALPPPVLRPISVVALLGDAASLFETRWQAQGVRLQLDPPSPDILIRLDGDLLIQALLNLLANGAEAALAGETRPPAVMLSASAQDDRLALRVTDSGAGVAAGQEEAIFRPFFTLKPGGTGIGLGLARHIALSHGGSLILEPAAPGRGAAFLLCL